MATKVSYRKIRSGCGEEFNNRRLFFFVMVNKAKQEKGQVTKFALNVRQLQVQKQE